MQLKIKENKSKLLQNWFEATIATYPPESARILGKKANRFDNPIGAITLETLDAVLDLLIESRPDRNSLEKALDPLIRIRAVQAFYPADAVSFIFALKTIAEKIFEDAESKSFDRLVDEIALAGFNKLMKCKEEIFLLKATESKRRIHKAFERAGLVAELKKEDFLGSYKV